MNILDKFNSLITLNWLTGPIFAKELRVASRRKRNYFLRMAFIFLLLIFIAYLWLFTMILPGGRSAGFVAGRMSIISRSVVCAVVWMLFVTLPLLATVMLSGSISQKVNKRTLDVLLTTPITPLQIVMGKAVSCFLQLLLLIGITLPLFSVIRVFGGVPWAHVVVFLWITLTTTCLFGAISLFYSVHCRNAFRVVVLTLVTGLFVFALVPGVLAWLAFYKDWSWVTAVAGFVSITNPFAALAIITESMMSSDPQGTAVFAWATHCAVITLTFMSILLLSVWRLHKNIPNMSAGKSPKGWSIKRLFGGKPLNNNDIILARKPVEITGDPIYWKEINRGEHGAMLGSKTRTAIVIGLVILIFVIALLNDWLVTKAFHAAFVTVIAVFAFLRIAILSAQSISTEKQSRTLPILLTTPLEDADILKKKRRAIFKKTSLYWYLIYGDIVLFTVLTVLHPIAIIGVSVAIVPAVLFLMGIGFYCGTRFKTTTGTMAATFAIPFVLWFFCPCFANFSPLMMIVMSITADFSAEMMMFGGIMMAMAIVPAILYAVAGIVLLTLAKSSMRKYVFNVAG